MQANSARDHHRELATRISFHFNGATAAPTRRALPRHFSRHRPRPDHVPGPACRLPLVAPLLPAHDPLVVVHKTRCTPRQPYRKSARLPQPRPIDPAKRGIYWLPRVRQDVHSRKINTPIATPFKCRLAARGRLQGFRRRGVREDRAEATRMPS